MLKETYDFLVDMITERYPKEYECSLKIKKYIKKKYGNEVSKEELAYLVVHIKRVSMHAEGIKTN